MDVQGLYFCATNVLSWGVVWGDVPVGILPPDTRAPGGTGRVRTGSPGHKRRGSK